MPFLDEATLTTSGKNHFKLVHWLDYEGKEEVFRVPAGTFTDFATVPQFLQWFAPSIGAYTRAAILHDYLCELARLGEISARDADGLFRRVMREAGVPLVMRWMMWTGVRWGSVASKDRKADIVPDLPKFLLITICSIPIVVPGALVALLGTMCYYLAEFFASPFDTQEA